ncbi:MAG: glycosyltransferase family 1 protein [Candidatus Omnitrophota bacterium]|jgi:glycosyltransferase involved in cell wall biosynthesis|nr:MAG: glycosyltransferase family 1 protein [Candidatus Omnitrophota bacterium]
MTSPPKICFPFIGETIGGSHLSTLLLINHIDRQRFHPVIVLHRQGALSAFLGKQGISYELLTIKNCVGREIGFLHHTYALMQAIIPIARFLRQNKIQIVHTQDMRMHLTWALPAKLVRCRFIWHQRSIWSSSRLVRWVSRCADRTVVISDFISKQCPFPLRNPAITITNPFDTSSISQIMRPSISASLRQEIHADANAKIIAFVGNYTQQKRILLFLEIAAALIRQTDHPMKFVLFGEEREISGNEIDAMANRLAIAPFLFRLGFRTPIETWLAACDLLIAPAVQEAHGRTLVESMLVGVPVIAAASGGHCEIIRHGETGWLVAPDQISEFVEAALRLLHDPILTSTIVKNANQSARQTYSIHSHVDTVCKLYDDLLYSG